jgi:hypothetical protein
VHPAPNSANLIRTESRELYFCFRRTASSSGHLCIGVTSPPGVRTRFHIETAGTCRPRSM